MCEQACAEQMQIKSNANANQIKSNQIKSNQIKSNQIKSKTSFNANDF
jgi:hypothetical protein